MGMRRVDLVLNKFRQDADMNKAMDVLDSTVFDHIFVLPQDELISINEPDISCLLDKESVYMEAVKDLATTLFSV
jgi:hypothetical protein